MRDINIPVHEADALDDEIMALLARARASGMPCVGEWEWHIARGRVGIPGDHYVDLRPVCPRHGVALRESSANSYVHFHCPYADLAVAEGMGTVPR